MKNHNQQFMSRTFTYNLWPVLMSLLTFLFLTIFLLTATTLDSVSAAEFVYNGNFNFTNVLLSGNATVESSILTLTNQSLFSIGRAFYPHKIPTRTNDSSNLLPFATSFIVSIEPPRKHYFTGHGFVFMFSPYTGINGTASSHYLGFSNFTNQGNPHNHVFGVEFDIFRNQEFNDIDDNHVGVDKNSLTSISSHTAGYWGGKDDNEFKELKLPSGENYQVWIEYEDSWLNVTMSLAGKKRPQRPLIRLQVNLSEVLFEEMYVGFSASTGQLVDSVRILAWSFSNSNFSIGDALVTRNLPSYVVSKGVFSEARPFIIGISVACVIIIGCSFMVFFILWRRKSDTEEELEDWELEYWPHRIPYNEIVAATNGFSEENVIGIGANGRVYRGVLQGVEVAVKQIPQETGGGMRVFLAEISSLGRMRHRNLVGLRGWCREEKSNLILVYDYMENGSLDKRIFECEERMMLSWEQRIGVLKNVAAGILYLHEGWEAQVLHRDIKASNVLLDKDMNARLGDFGLARMHDHNGQVAGTTKVIGTVGYIAPEVVRAGRASTLSDVFGFGILILEVVCGRRPIEEHKPGLIQWVLSLMEIGDLHCAVDERLKAKGGYPIEEAEKLLHLGLLCAHSNPNVRPTMRQVVKILEGETEGTEPDEDSMEVILLGRLKSQAIWSESSNPFACSVHPTMHDLVKSSFNSKSLSVAQLPSQNQTSQGKAGSERQVGPTFTISCRVSVRPL